MNCGLGNLASLKAHLLASSLGPNETRFDAIIADLGRGVAGLMDQYCNRTLAYGENLTQIFSGDRDHWYLPAFPLVSIASVQLRYFLSDNFADITQQPLAMNAETGLLHFGYTLGRTPIQVRVTWTGGYWFQSMEPDDNGYANCSSRYDAAYPSALPAAVQASAPGNNPPGLEPYKFILPNELRLAWLMQCRRIWRTWDKTGVNLLEEQKNEDKWILQLGPEVAEILDRYKRYQAS